MIDWVIVSIFIFEFVIKVIAEECRPLRVFQNHEAGGTASTLS